MSNSKLGNKMYNYNIIFIKNQIRETKNVLKFVNPAMFRIFEYIDDESKMFRTSITIRACKYQ